ncbi:hypothetical protein [Halopiger xanaduensis]|uniref:Uncharacterized protein n=1 Tax=Halopiger xanaduensis (strain DSM 18323 / JCM 14033 / SH-6) TaxID=797210 RepID=F8D6F1_HALXS|nr:hypothetical protein [Halopiger xanaduensis]AEH36538.1 hypothetical protein Halxa_1911 [Halopiger xanaduensis SH-6]
MSTSDSATDADGSVVEEYVLGVRIVGTDGPDERYRFEAPEHTEIAFDSLEDASRYADVYFVVNGFVEEETGERGVPPEVIQGGRDTLAVYLLTRPWADVNWVASFFGTAPSEIERYCSRVRERADELRAEAKAQNRE